MEAEGLMKGSTIVRFLMVMFAWSAAGQYQPPPKPFIEPLEHQHGKVMLKRLAVPAHPELTGRWATLSTTMPINPVHVALMRTGNVLVISGTGNDPTNKVLTAGVFNPTNQTISTFTIDWDMF